MHICNFEEFQLIKVGRGAAADIRISDISVSRYHSHLWLSEDGVLTIVDNHSKFGTLKLLSEPLQVNAVTHTPIYVQIGRTLLSISCEATKRDY